MTVIVTRPPDQAGPWVDALRARGLDARALPLIDIEPPADAGPVRAAWQALPGCRLVMFVSANAVKHFFALAPPGAAWPAGTWAGATGPGTSAALRAQRVPAAAIVEPPPDSPQFDSEALWKQLAPQDWRGRRVWVVRGEQGRDWLAEALRGAGADVGFVAAYRRCVPRLDDEGRALLGAALAEPLTHGWIFSSSEAVANLGSLAPGADWSRSAAVASHPRIAEAARALGFGRVRIVPPDVAAVASALAGFAR